MPRSSASLLPPPAPVADACLGHGARSILRRPLLLLGLAIALALLEGLSAHTAAVLPGGTLVGVALAVFVLAPVAWGVSFVGLRVVRGGRASAPDALRVLDNYREAVAAHVLVWLAVALGLACFVVPGVVVYLRTRYVPYLVVEEELDAASAIAESWRLTRGHTPALLGISVAGALAVAAGMMLGGIGVVPAFLWWDVALASLYHATVAPSERFEPAGSLARPVLSY